MVERGSVPSAIRDGGGSAGSVILDGGAVVVGGGTAIVDGAGGSLGSGVRVTGDSVIGAVPVVVMAGDGTLVVRGTTATRGRDRARVVDDVYGELTLTSRAVSC